MERTVDVAEEMDFLYGRTGYASILRAQRAADRAMDREFGDRAYWRKREMVKDGLIDSEDDTTPECSDDEEDEEEAEEEDRRDRAKRKALADWKKKNPTHSPEDLPRTMCS